MPSASPKTELVAIRPAEEADFVAVGAAVVGVVVWRTVEFRVPVVFPVPAPKLGLAIGVGVTTMEVYVPGSEDEDDGRDDGGAEEGLRLALLLE